MPASIKEWGKLPAAYLLDRFGVLDKVVKLEKYIGCPGLFVQHNVSCLPYSEVVCIVRVGTHYVMAKKDEYNVQFKGKNLFHLHIIYVQCQIYK